MKKTLLALTLLSASTPALAAQYTLDPAHTNIQFAIDHFGTSTNRATFYAIEGQVQFDRAQKTGSINVVIPLKNLNSGNSAFDKHLKSSDIFNAETYPTMRFVSSRWIFNDQGNPIAIDGKLTLLGQTHPVRLNATQFNCYQSPMAKTQVCGGDFHATIDRSRWGLNYLVDKGFTKNVDLTIQVEAVLNQGEKAQ